MSHRLATILFLTAWCLAVAMCHAVGADQPAASEATTEDQAESEQAEPVRISGLHVGLNGVYKAGVWTPVRVFLNAPAPRDATVELAIADSDGIPVRYTSPCEGLREASLLVRFGSARGKIVAAVAVGEDVLDARTFRSGASVAGDAESSESSTTQGQGSDPALSDAVSDEPDTTVYLSATGPDQPILVSIGSADEPLTDALSGIRGPVERRPRLVAIDRWNEMPTRVDAYEAIDTIILSLGNGAFFEENAADGVLSTIEQWVRQGGNLLILAGTTDTAYAPPEDSPLGRLLPGRLADTVTVRETAPATIAIESYAEGVKPLQMDGTSAYPWLQVRRLEDVRGHVELPRDYSPGSATKTPLVVRSVHDFGTVTFFAADPTEPPLSQWNERGRLMAKLIGASDVVSDEAGESRRLMSLGYEDLSGQLRSALDIFPGVYAAPFSLIVGLILLYVALIGPADYYLVNHVLKRPRLTWVTMPTTIVAFTLLALFLVHWTRGDQLLVNQVDLVDVDVASGQVRGVAWANVYNPDTSAYDLQFVPSLLAEADADSKPSDQPTATTAWLGLTGSALGGMEAGMLQPTLWESPYDESTDLTSLSGVPIPIRSTKSFTGRWTGATTALPEATLTDRDGLEGTIINTTGVPLRDCLLIHDRWAYQLGDAPADAVLSLDERVSRRDVGRLLTETQIVETGDKQKHIGEQSKSYDQTNTDPVAIVTAMMFYRLADGRYRTGLSNSYQGFVDMSRLVAADRAVLVGVVDSDAMQGSKLAVTATDGETIQTDGGRTTICRFVFPVNSEDSRRD